MTDLARAIAKVLADDDDGGAPSAQLANAAAELSARYRTGAPTRLQSEREVDAYLATRLPATTAAVGRIMREVRDAWPGLQPQRQLDLGAGPGAAAWAAAAVWPGPTEVVLVDRDERMIDAGKALAGAADGVPFGHWQWRHADIVTGMPRTEPADLVTATYVLGELEPEAARTVAAAAWDLTKGCLILAEPGTPAGFERIRSLRDQLLGLGAHLVAPCPHEGPCPVQGTDWCHFAVRVNRSATHRRLKGGELSFEDEKVSYVAFARPAGIGRAAGRVLRHPTRRRRFVELTVCVGDEITRVPLGQSHPAYRAAGKLHWGDAVPGEVLGHPGPPTT
ncbi:MAG TPA: small ribosomal subunit Rsm22 family protein [Acidimicrobiales bacterium]|nr:small ribosomal subunit Rsm22 family protein [Acidimicrobiales bacterium]